MASMASEGTSGGSAEERDQISGDLALALSLQTNTGDEDENGDSKKNALLVAAIHGTVLRDSIKEKFRGQIKSALVNLNKNRVNKMNGHALADKIIDLAEIIEESNTTLQLC
ncbi:hypothetical protein B484DRAFT_393292 [Ochromonadaceae sp. CCMP2298]|nr:hypothetical protein B484DRAFT_393292 [Ochromonadaceae sp. CCMP2298]